MASARSASVCTAVLVSTDLSTCCCVSSNRDDLDRDRGSGVGSSFECLVVVAGLRVVDVVGAAGGGDGDRALSFTFALVPPIVPSLGFDLDCSTDRGGLVIGAGCESSSSNDGVDVLLVDLEGRRPPSFPNVFRGEDFVIVGAAGCGLWLFCREANCEVDVVF